MISLAITNYNRSGFVVESFIEVLHNPHITEIVIVDDCSDVKILDNLKQIISCLNTDKIKVYRNEERLGVFANKCRSVELSTNEGVIMFDSDNVISNDYVNTMASLSKEADVYYCPETLYDISGEKVQWEYSEFNDIYITRDTVTKFIYNENYQTFLNSGNGFVNRKFFLEVIRLIDEPVDDICSGDSAYLNYLWLLKGGRTSIVKGVSYRHRMHGDSWYIKHVPEAIAFIYKINQKFKAFDEKDS